MSIIGEWDIIGTTREKQLLKKNIRKSALLLIMIMLARSSL